MKSRDFSKKGLAKLALMGLATGLMISNSAGASSIQFDDNNELNQQMAKGGCPGKCPNRPNMNGKGSCNGKGGCNGLENGNGNGNGNGIENGNGNGNGETAMNERTRRYNPNNPGQISMSQDSDVNGNGKGSCSGKGSCKGNGNGNGNGKENGKDKGSCGGSGGCGGLSL